MDMPHRCKSESIKNMYAEGLDEILGDPLLSDLPHNVTVDEIKSLIALEQGQAMTVKVCKLNSEIYPIIINQNATVQDLLKAIERHIGLKQKRCGDSKKISWKYVWKSFWLVFESEKLKDHAKKLKDYGICNRSEVMFVKRLNTK